MKEDYIEVSIDSPSPIDFSNGDYIIYDYNGIKYTLSDPIGVKKQARKDTYSKAFVYTGIKFNSNFNLLFRCMFLDIVQEDNLNHYTSLPDVDTFEDVYGIAGRIQANLDNQYPNTFNIKIVDTTGNAELESILRTARAFNVSNGYCSDALSTIYDQWGVGYIYTVEGGKDTIIIGGTAGESTVFRYGKNNGLRVITSDIQNLSELCNRIFPFGSTRNLPARWYNKKQYIQDPQYAPNLLIPKSKWGDNNPRSAFVENIESINKYGLRPKAIYWDGSDSDRIEICPSIEGVTAGIIRQAKAEAEDTTYVPSTELYPDDELVDEILVGDNIEDDGLNIDTGYKLYSEQYAYAYNAEEGKDFQTNKIGTIGKDGAELGFAFTFEMPNKLTPFTLPKDAVYRIGNPDHELEVIGYNTLPYLYIPRTYAKSYATYLFSQNHPAYLVGRAEGTNDYWRWECSIEESDDGFTIRPIAEQTVSLRAGSSLFFSFEVSASILFSDNYAIEHLNEEIFATCYIRGGGFYIQRGLNYIFQDFNIYIKQIGFNIADYPSEDNNYITININTGSCAGRSFKIRKVEYDSALDRWKLNCYRSDDNTLSLRFPNSDFHISAGDKFVITNIQMPDLYVYMAMERLYNEALKELNLLSNPSRIYTPEIDNLQMARSPQVLRVGMFMPISDDDLNIQSNNAILIDSIEVSEGENAIRTFSVTLRNEKQDNILKKNKKDIKSISVALKKSNSEASRVSSNESVNQDSTGVTGGGTSVSSYDNLTNKPSINDVELKGNLTSENLGLQPKGKYVIEDDFNKHTNNKDIHISSEEREKWNNKSNLTAEDVKKIKVNNAGHADSADNATKAGLADKLTNSRKIFGLPFDGAKDVVGGITADGDSVIRGNLNVTKDAIVGGEVVAIAGNAEPAGVTDYAQLKGKPAINGKELASGNNTLDALGIQPKGDYTTASQLASTLEDYATKVFVSNNYASKAAVNTIQALIPATASATNQLADKDFVNSSIATATAEFRGSFTSLDELKATSGNLNDYAFYLHTDNIGNKVVDRYKWTTAGWLYEYTLNNSSFTAEQWAALNSAITATLVQSYNNHLKNSTIHITSDERTKWNNKWDYNEATIKAVKVNAAGSADYASSAGDADTLDGVHYQNILERTHSGASLSGTATGWFRIAESLTTDAMAITFLLAIKRDYWTIPNESYLFSISISYGGGISITQLSGYANERLITKIRVDWAGGKIAYVDLYINTSVNQSTYYWYTIGCAKSYTAWTANPTLVGTAYEFTTVNGCKSDRGFAGDLVGNSSSATKLQDNTAFTVWGQKFFENGKPKNVSGDLTNVGNITASGKATIQGDIVCGGEVVAIAGEGTPAGVTDYSALTGKPQINGVTLVSGNNTLAALGIQAAGDYVTNSGVTTLLADYTTKTFVSNNYAGKAAFNAHIADNNIHITSAERAAWDSKWDYNEATIKAVKVTAASSADSVAWTGIKGKPTTFTPSAHTHTASDVSGLPTSLKNPYALSFGSKTYDGSAAATITASDLGALTAHQSIYALTLQVNGTSKGVYNPASAAKTINIAVPTKTSDITNDSGFITNAAIPTALKNPYAVEIKANGVSLGTYDGSAAATFNLSAANVGAASKVHSHTASEISGLPTNLSAFTNDVGYITGITKSMVEGVLTGDITSHTHTFASLTSKPTTISGYGITDALTTSNYNSYAPTLTGTGASGTWGINISGNAAKATYATNAANIIGGLWSEKSNPNLLTAWSDWGNESHIGYGGFSYGIYSISQDLTYQFLLGSDALKDGLFFRRKNSDGWGDWKVIAFTDSNVASATKLQDDTAFTAWGQTFFENGKPKNVSGDLNVGVSKLYWNWDSVNYYMSCSGTSEMTYNMHGGHIFSTGGLERMRIRANGNILIGTTTDNGYKLQVNGSERVYGDLIVDGEVSALVA